MARISRKEILGDNLYYHIIARGNGKRAIFRCRMDYKLFINITHKYLIKFPLHIYHYCLMKNHIHLIIQTTEGWMLPKFMQGALQRYAYHFRKKYDSPGYLFQNRYKCFPITKENYLMDCGRYIERNPLRAYIVNDISKYGWSSFNFYANGWQDNLIVKPNPLYLELSNTDSERQKKYKEYILETRPSDLIEK